MHESRNDRKQGDITSIYDLDCIVSLDPRAAKFRVGKAFHEAFKENNDKSKIYTALIGASKAAHYFCHRYAAPFSYFDVAKESELSIYLPIVVVDGRLFEVYNDYNGDIELQEQGHVPVEMSYSSPHYRKGIRDSGFLPDIVTAAYLPQYLKDLEAWRKSILERTTPAIKRKWQIT